MVNLGDYIGHLLSEVTIARVKADLEAVRIAELYSSEPLLRSFPIPRVRFSNVEMSVPMKVSDVKGLMEASPPKKIDTPTLVKIAEHVIVKKLKEKNINLTTRENQLLKRKIKAKSDDIKAARERGISMTTISKNISGEILNSIKDMNSVKSVLKVSELRGLGKNVELKLNEELFNLRQQPARIKISPLTSEIHNIDKPESMVTMKITLMEDAFELTTIEDEDGEREILVPE